MTNQLIWKQNNSTIKSQQLIATVLVDFNSANHLPPYPDLSIAVHYKITAIKNHTELMYKLQIISAHMTFTIGEYTQSHLAQVSAQNYHEQFSCQINENTDFAKYPVLLLKLLGFDLDAIQQSILV